MYFIAKGKTLIDYAEYNLNFRTECGLSYTTHGNIPISKIK